MFINIEGNIINLDDLVLIREATLSNGKAMSPALSIKLREEVTLNLFYNSKEEVIESIKKIESDLNAKGYM